MAKKKRDPNAYPVLGEFEGKSVTGATLILTNAGDGLSQAMQIEPVVIHHGELVYLLIEAECVKVRYDPVKDDDDALTRVHIVKAGVSTIVDSEFADEKVEAQRVKIEQAAGIERLPLGEGEGEGTPTDGPLTEPTSIGDLAKKEADRQARMAARREKNKEASDGEG